MGVLLERVGLWRCRGNLTRRGNISGTLVKGIFLLYNVINIIIKENKMKKSFAFDYRILLYIILAVFVGVLAYSSAKTDKDIGMALLFGTFALVMVFGIVIHPKFYIGDEEGLSIYYLPFVKEYFKWNEIKRIKLKDSRITSRSSLLDFLWKEYEIVPVKKRNYKGSKYHSIFHSSEIFKSPLAVRMIKKYWDGNIEDNSFSWIKKYFQKEDKIVKYDLTEVKQKEKSARDAIKQIVSQYASKAELYGKTIDASCTYFADNEDFNSRPKENYSYVAEIFVEKENDEDRSFYINVELLFVSYGKSKIKIAENKKAFKEIEKQINEAIEK